MNNDKLFELAHQLVDGEISQIEFVLTMQAPSTAVNHMRQVMTLPESVRSRLYIEDVWHDEDSKPKKGKSTERLPRKQNVTYFRKLIDFIYTENQAPHDWRNPTITWTDGDIELFTFEFDNISHAHDMRARFVTVSNPVDNASTVISPADDARVTVPDWMLFKHNLVPPEGVAYKQPEVDD